MPSFDACASVSAFLVGFGFASAALGAIFYVIPVFGPCLAPHHDAAAMRTVLFRKYRFDVGHADDMAQGTAIVQCVLLAKNSDFGLVIALGKGKAGIFCDNQVDIH